MPTESKYKGDVKVYRLLPAGKKGPLIRVEDCNGKTVYTVKGRN